MDPIKISGIANWPIPKTVKDVRSFLGFCNFYWAFIQGFANIAHPLNQLTWKDVEWTWGTVEQQAFDDLRWRVTAEPVLKQPESDKPFKLEVDTLGFAIGAVLLQHGKDNKRHPIGYYSATLIEAKWNYDIYDLELLAIVKALRNWQPFLAGSPHIITVHTDHANLQYWRQPQKISRHIAQEVAELAEYNMVLWHIPGKANGRADALSRHLDYDQGTCDNENITVLPDQMFIHSLIINEPIHEQKMSVIWKWMDAHRLKEFGGKWYKEGRLVVTGDAAEWRRIVKEFHDPPTAGHPGIAWTKDLITRSYWWPKLQKDVKDYVKGCAQCQANKINTHTHKAPLISNNDDSQDSPIPDCGHGFHHQTAPIWWMWHHPDNHRSGVYEDGPISSLLRNHHSRRSSPPISASGLQTIRIAHEDHQWLRYALYVQIHKRTLLSLRNHAEYLHSIPPPYGWTISTYQPMVGTIFTFLDQSQADQLDNLPISCGICTQHVVQRDNMHIPLSLTHGVWPESHVGNNQVAATPDHHKDGTDDGSMTDGIQCTTMGRRVMGTMETSTMVQRRRSGVARGMKHSHITPHHKVGTQTIWSLSHHQSTGTGDISTPSSRTVEYPPGVPHGSPYAI